MAALSFALENTSAPQILAAEKDFLVVYKPPRVHSAPLANSAPATLIDRCVHEFPEVAGLPGRKPGEGGLLHRLDYETQGLLLVARTRQGMESLLSQQREGKIVKEYSALAAETNAALPGFPADKPELPARVFSGGNGEAERARITSGFRPYGPGRKAVRPVILVPGGETRNAPYSTAILETRPVSAAGFSCLFFRLMILKGFRHQIRSHLSWIGRPILNDGLYAGSACGTGLLGLRASSLFFTDPSSGEERSYSIPHLTPADL